jgi:hypothetical protein
MVAEIVEAARGQAVDLPPSRAHRPLERPRRRTAQEVDVGYPQSDCLGRPQASRWRTGV